MLNIIDYIMLGCIAISMIPAVIVLCVSVYRWLTTNTQHKLPAYKPIMWVGQYPTRTAMYTREDAIYDYTSGHVSDSNSSYITGWGNCGSVWIYYNITTMYHNVP